MKPETQHPPQKAPQGISAVLAFAMEQFIAWLGVPIVAGVGFGLGSDIARVFGRTLTSRESGLLLTGTPFFPMDIFVGLFLGWWLQALLRQRSMVWVWILPFVVLSAAVVLQPHFTPDVFRFRYPSVLEPGSRLSHFFGWGCQPRNHCLDQMFVTMPFYSAPAYSVGAFWASRRPRPRFVTTTKAMSPERILLLVVLPCLCIVLALTWNANALLLKTRPWEVSAGAFLFVVPIETAVLAFAVVFAVSLCGTRSFLMKSLEPGEEER
jgi:hypothetical protein